MGVHGSHTTGIWVSIAGKEKEKKKEERRKEREEDGDVYLASRPLGFSPSLVDSLHQITVAPLTGICENFLKFYSSSYNKLQESAFL